jgi:type I restriction enzyme S subunit
MPGRARRAAAPAGPVDEPWALPEGWRWERLADVTCEPARGSPASRFNGHFRYLDVSGMEGGTVAPRLVATGNAPSRARQFVEAGDTVLSGVRVYLRNIARLRQDQVDVASTAFCVLRPMDGLDPDLLYHWVSSDPFINRLLPLQRGNSPPAVLDDDVRSQLMPVPPPAVQRAIVARIDALFAEIGEGEEALRRARDGVETWRRSLLKAAVTGALTADWRAQNPPTETGEALLARILADRRTRWLADPRNARKPYKPPTAPDTTNLPTLPDGWTWASLQQLGDFGRGKSKHRPRDDPRLYGGPYPFIQTGIVADSDGLIDRYDQTYSEVGRLQSKLWPAGTLCITIAANIAKTGVLEFDACFPDSIVGLACAKGVIPHYVELFVRTVREELDRWAPATAQKNINLETLSGVALPLPPTNEQAQIVQAVKRETGLEQVLDPTDGLQAEAATLRQSILAAAFRGELVA